MSTFKFLLSFLVLSTASWSQTLTITSGNGQLAHLGTGLGGGPVVFQLMNGTTPVANATIVFSNTNKSTFIPLSPTTAVTNSSGTATVQFVPAFLGSQQDEVYELIATSGAASLTFFESASQPPLTVSLITSSPNVLFPFVGTAGTPANFHFVTSITGGLANVSTRIVPVEKGTPPPGTPVQTGYCLEGKNEPEKAVYSNVNGQATCTPVLNVPNAALNPAYDTYTFDVVVGGAFVFGPYNYSITSIPLAASLSSNMVLAQLNASLSIPITVTGGIAPYTFTVPTGDGSLPPGISISSAGVITGTPTSPGKFVFSVDVTDHSGSSKTVGPLTIGVSTGAVQVTPTALAAATLGVPYSQTLQLTGGIPPYTWALSAALPAGLTATLADATGDMLVISGTPTVAGTISLTFLITDSFGEKFPVPMIYTLAVLNPLKSTTNSFPIATVGSAYSTGISVSGGTAPYTYTVTGLPAGLVLNANGTITGTPTSAGSTTVTVTITDSLGQTSSFTTSIEVSNGTFSYPAKAAIPAAVVGTPYSTQLPAPTGGVPPYTFAFSGAAPAGFTLSASGLLTGTPTAIGSLPIDLTVKDSSTQALTVALTLTVSSNLPTIVSVVNGGSFLVKPPAPGELVSLFGTTLGPLVGAGFTLNSSGGVPTTLAGVQVSFNGIPAPILYVSATQVNAVVPFGSVPGTTVPVTVSYNGNTSATFSQTIGLTDPSVFLIGTTQGAILNSNYSVNGAANPASAGDFIQIYGTGAGAFTPPLTDGQLATGPSSPSIPNVVVTIGGVAANVLYAGAAPGEVAGVYQMNVVVPAGVAAGSAVPLIVSIGGASSATETVTVAIQ